MSGDRDLVHRLPRRQLGLQGVEFSRPHLALLLELSDPNDRLGGALVGLIDPDAQPDDLGLGTIGPVGLGRGTPTSLCGAMLRRLQRRLELTHCRLALLDARQQPGRVSGVLGGPRLGEVTIGLGLDGPVTGSLEARFAQLGVGHPGGRGAEKEGDDATADLGVRRTDVHDKAAWMLRSHLEG